MENSRNADCVAHTLICLPSPEFDELLDEAGLTGVGGTSEVSDVETDDCTRVCDSGEVADAEFDDWAEVCDPGEAVDTEFDDCTWLSDIRLDDSVVE
jgi:hypothetical protein